MSSLKRRKKDVSNYEMMKNHGTRTTKAFPTEKPFKNEKIDLDQFSLPELTSQNKVAKETKNFVSNEDTQNIPHFIPEQGASFQNFFEPICCCQQTLRDSKAFKNKNIRKVSRYILGEIYFMRF